MGLRYNKYSCMPAGTVSGLMVRQAPVGDITGACRVIRLLLFGPAWWLTACAQAFYFVYREYPSAANLLGWLGNLIRNERAQPGITYT